MSNELRRHIESEVMLISAFASAYRPRFESVIRQMNHTHGATHEQVDAQAAMRLCLEATGMILETQARLARLLTDAVEAESAR